MGKYTAIDDPSAYFTTTLYTGNGSTQNITNDANAGNFKPDYIWTKARGDTGGHAVQDSNRGAGKQFYPHSTYYEENVEGVSAFLTNGFSLGSNGTSNANNITHVAWQWKCNGGTTASDSNGSITSTVQANQDAGFSIVTYTTAGSAGTIGHGLGAKPDVIIVKKRNGTMSWYVRHVSTGTSYLLLNSTAAAASNPGPSWTTTEPTSSVFSIGTSSDFNVNGGTYAAYCFAEKQGYSKFGSYKGNSHSGGKGTFVYTGFAPARVLIKRTDVANDWIIHDYKFGTKNSTGSSKGNEGNLNSAALRANETSALDDWGDIDMLSNGFKPRSDAASVNATSTYIYMAFAAHPFVTSTGTPTTAR